MARLARTARALGRHARLRKPGWPTLWLFTDPGRTPDLLVAVSSLPPGSGVVLRTFGEAAAERQAAQAARLARERGLMLLVGADPELAESLGADGVHLPERLMARLPRLRARHPAWRLTAAAHGGLALADAARLGADAAFLSPALPSRSPSAGPPLGAVRAAALIRGARLPVVLLGGVKVQTAPRLLGSGAAGLAGVGFVKPGGP